MMQSSLPLYQTIEEVQEVAKRSPLNESDRHWLSESEKEFILQLITAYGSARIVSEMTGLSRHTIYRIRDEARKDGRYADVMSPTHQECITEAWRAVRLGIDRCVEALADRNIKMSANDAARIVSQLSRFLEGQRPAETAPVAKPLDDMTPGELYDVINDYNEKLRPHSTH